jgi:hypothetical protein
VISVKISHKVEGVDPKLRIVVLAELTRDSVVHLLSATIQRHQPDGTELTADQALDDAVARLMMQVITTVMA